MSAPATGVCFGPFTTRTGANPSGTKRATSRPSIGTSTRRVYDELIKRTSTRAGPGGKFESATRPSASVAPPHELSRGMRVKNGEPAGPGRSAIVGTGAPVSGDADTRTPLSGPRGEVIEKLARPAAITRTRTVPAAGTATSAAIGSGSLPHGELAVVRTRYRPAAKRWNVARPSWFVRTGTKVSGDRGRTSSSHTSCCATGAPASSTTST